MLHIPTRWQARSNTKPARRAQLDALTRGDLFDIARLDFGTSKLPDNQQGEQFLYAFLLKGMPATQVPDVAPWARRRGDLLERLIDRASAERRKPGPDRLGEIIDFSFDKLKRLKWRYGISIKHVRPFDAEKWKVKEFWSDERLETDRDRKRKDRKRAKARKMAAEPATSERAALVRKAIGWRWTSVNAIMTAVEPMLPLARPVLRVAVHRALNELLRCGLAEDKFEAGKRGIETRFARRSDMGARR